MGVPASKKLRHGQTEKGSVPADTIQNPQFRTDAEPGPVTTGDCPVIIALSTHGPQTCPFVFVHETVLEFVVTQEVMYFLQRHKQKPGSHWASPPKGGPPYKQINE